MADIFSSGRVGSRKSGSIRLERQSRISDGEPHFGGGGSLVTDLPVLGALHFPW
jgi:hypothetical protein